MKIEIVDNGGTVHHLIKKSMSEVKDWTPLLTELTLEKVIKNFKVSDECERD